MRKNKKFRLSIMKTIHRIIMISLVLILTGCGGGGGGDDDPVIAPYDEAWTKVEIADLSEEAGGLLSPQINAVQDSNGIIHFSYYNDVVAKYTITADVSDVAGNAATQATVLFTKDETTAATIDILPVTGDNIVTDTEDDSVTISGTTTGVEAGQFVNVTIEDAGGNTVYAGPINVTVDEFDNWSIPDIDMSDLADVDGYTVFADVYDAIGNSAVQATEPFNITDTTALIIDIFPVTGDNIVTGTEDDSVTLQGTTTGVEQGQTVTVNIIDGTNTNVYSGTATVQADGTWSIVNVDLSALPNEDDNYNYGIFYKTYDPSYNYGESGITEVEPELIVMTERCNALSMTLKTDNLPVIAYQGGTPLACGSAHLESDIMFQVLSQNSWTEYTGAAGYNPRTPYEPYQDGYAGRTISIISDNENNIHTSYQLFYEGCDAMNNELPDQDYVRFSAPYSDQGPNGEGEETVDGNTYFNFGNGLQGRQGDGGKIILDSAGNPVIFYIAEFANVYGVRVAVRLDTDQWESEWIEIIDNNNYEVGYLSPALSPDGTLGVAYNLEQLQGSQLDDSNHLRYAEKKLPTVEIPEPTWISEDANILSICGEFCSLAYDSEGNPAVAYYVTRTYSNLDRNDLVFSYKNDNIWVRETVAYSGNIGRFNTLWFSETDETFHVSTFVTNEQQEQKVYLFNRYK